MRPFRLLGASQIAFLRDQVDARVQAWAREWLQQPGGTVDLAPLSRAARPDGPWLAAEAGGCRCHLQHRPGAIERLVFGAVAARGASPAAGEAARAALTDLARRLLDAGEAPACIEAAPAEVEHERASGAAVAALAFAAGAFDLVLDGAATARLLASRPRPARERGPAPVPLRSAIASARVSLGASIGGAEIDVATLQSLAPGDVLTLDLAIDKPLRVRVGGTDVRRGAYLGTHHGRRALRLTASYDPPETRPRESQP